MSSETIQMPRLNDRNYPEWAIRCEALIIKRQLGKVVFPGDNVNTEAKLQSWKEGRDKDKMAEARSEMVLRVEDGQLAHMRSKDPYEIWLTLERVHRATGFATSLALRRQFLSSKKTPDMTMQAWIGHIENLAFRLEAADIKVPDQDKILALTMGLPPSYNAVIINFDATAPDLLTLRHVIARLLNEETRQASAPTDDTDEGPENVGLAVSGPHRSRKPNPTGNSSATSYQASGTPSSEHTCFFCDEKGHFKQECTDRLEWQRYKRSRGKGKEAAASAEYVSDGDEWAF